MNRGLALGFFGALLLGLVLRLPGLGERPLHTDEAVHAYKFIGLWQGAGYRYDPDEYHGPSLYYFTLPLAWASRASSAADLSETTLRLVPLGFGLGLILLLALFHDGLGRAGTLWAALFTAVSTAFVYYSRYYIHELLLVFFVALFGGALWRYWRRPSLGWALLAGAALGLMHATKETLVFHLAALGAAAAALLWFAPDPRAAWRDLRARLDLGPLALGGLVAVVISVTLFTSFFTHRDGPLDSLRTYLPWLGRAGGDSPHLHPWYFYLERVFWFRPASAGPTFSEGLIGLLALVGAATGFLPARRSGPASPGLARFLAFYTLALLAGYSVIPYKTPWCVLGFLHGAILLAGLGAAAVFRWIRPTWVLILVFLGLAAATAQLGRQAWRASRTMATDQRNPYVYAHTSMDLLRLVHRVHGIAATHATPAALGIHVMAAGGDYWPLPWYLRQYTEVSWSAGVPEDPYAPVVIAGARLHAELDEKSNKRWISAGYYEHRPRVFFELFVELELWKRYLDSLPREPDDEDED